LDYVHNSERDPHVIFTSLNNPSRALSDSSQHLQHKFEVDRQFNLIIRRVGEEDVGNYFCRRVVTDSSSNNNNNVMESFNGDTTSYFVTAYAAPRCEGEATLQEGGATLLSCQSEFIGNVDPAQLQWIRQSANGMVSDVISDDRFDIRLAARDLHLTSLSYHDDGATYICHLAVGDVIEQCSVTLNVSNSVHDLEMNPIKDVYNPGDEIRCAAAGNPVPTITMMPSSSHEKSGSGWKSVIVDDDWVGRQIELSCVAWNNVAGQQSKLSMKLTVNAYAVVTTTSKVTKVDDEKSIRSQSSLVQSGPIVAGIVIGLVILGAVIVAVVCIRICKDRREKKEVR
jgi:hypothetical protein